MQLDRATREPVRAEHRTRSSSTRATTEPSPGRQVIRLRLAYRAPYDSWENRIATLRFVQDIPLEPGDPSYDAVSEVADGLARFRDVPILLLWGEKDFVFQPKVLTIFEEIWPHAESHRFPDAGHYVLEDAGAEITPILRDFLKRHPL